MHSCEPTAVRSTRSARLIPPECGAAGATRRDSHVSDSGSAWFEICAPPSNMRDQRAILHGNASCSLVDHVVTLPQPVKPSLLDCAVAGLGRLLCRMHGHDMLPQFSSNRMFLKCASCG